MKLNAKLKNNRGGIKQTSDDIRILIDLNYKNTFVGTLSLYAIIDDKVEGYCVLWKNNVIEVVEKGKKQKDKLNFPCPVCGDSERCDCTFGDWYNNK